MLRSCPMIESYRVQKKLCHSDCNDFKKLQQNLPHYPIKRVRGADIEQTNEGQTPRHTPPRTGLCEVSGRSEWNIRLDAYMDYQPCLAAAVVLHSPLKQYNLYDQATCS